MDLEASLALNPPTCKAASGPRSEDAEYERRMVGVSPGAAIREKIMTKLIIILKKTSNSISQNILKTYSTREKYNSKIVSDMNPDDISRGVVIAYKNSHS